MLNHMVSEEFMEFLICFMDGFCKTLTITQVSRKLLRIFVYSPEDFVINHFRPSLEIKTINSPQCVFLDVIANNFGEFGAISQCH